MNKINVFYNYYSDKNPRRKCEIDTCLKKLVENGSISNLFVITESAEELPFASLNTTKIQLENRPSFQSIFELISDKSADSDVNVVLNSDCFFEESDCDRIRSIKAFEAYCISRIEVRNVSPIRINKRRTAKNWKRHSDTQDCWIFTGKPIGSMWLDFYMGKPGCDNRLAYEFQNAGYEISNPRTEISIYHYHCTELRRYGEVERVPEPYLFPIIRDKAIWSNLLFR